MVIDRRDDNALAIAIKDGDESALAKLMSRHRNFLYYKARLRLGCHHDAEEAVMTLFEQVWHGAAARWDPSKASFKHYMYRCFHYVLNVKVRDRSRYRRLMQEHWEREVSESRHMNDPSRSLAHEQAEMLLENALAEVSSPKARQAYILKYLEGYSLKEIGRILNVKSQYAGTLIQYCKKHLKKILASDHYQALLAEIL